MSLADVMFSSNLRTQASKIIHLGRKNFAANLTLFKACPKVEREIKIFRAVGRTSFSAYVIPSTF